MDRFLNQIIQGDCLDVMRDIPDKSVDMILCDLPYGTTACKWDTVIPFEPLWAHYKRVIKDNGAIVLTASQPFTTSLIASNMGMFKYCWVWEKTKAANFPNAPNMPLKTVEDVVVFSFATIAQNSINRMKYYPQGLIDTNKVCAGKKANDHRPNRADQKPYKQTKSGYPGMVLRYGKEIKSYHPTQKPVALFEYLIRTYTNEGEIVLDNCIGSGTTAVASLNTGRFFIGIEKSEEYCRIAKERIERVNQLGRPLFTFS